MTYQDSHQPIPNVRCQFRLVAIAIAFAMLSCSTAASAKIVHGTASGNLYFGHDDPVLPFGEPIPAGPLDLYELFGPSGQKWTYNFTLNTDEPNSLKTLSGIVKYRGNSYQGDGNLLVESDASSVFIQFALGINFDISPLAPAYCELIDCLNWTPRSGVGTLGFGSATLDAFSSTGELGSLQLLPGFDSKVASDAETSGWIGAIADLEISFLEKPTGPFHGDGVTIAQGWYGYVPDRIQITGIPEPATWGLMCLGLVLAGWGLRNRHSRHAASVIAGAPHHPVRNAMGIVALSVRAAPRRLSQGRPA